MDLTALRPCPICGTAAEGVIQEVAADSVWTAYRLEYGVELPQDVKTRHAPSGSWACVKCSNCRLEYFADATQGDAEFYRLLTSSPLYYEPERWEFKVVRRRLPTRCTVLDIGCGTGSFLNSLPSLHHRTGIDHNEPALQQLRESSPEIVALCQDATVHAERRARSYDVVTAFQILEHVEQPRELVRATRELVAPGGSIYLSVPHQDRSGRADFEVLDHPPHHLTRWRMAQLRELACTEGISLTNHWYEPPDASLRNRVLTDVGQRHLRRLPAPIRDHGVRAWRRLAEAPLIRHNLIARHFFSQRGVTGHTLLAELRKD